MNNTLQNPIGIDAKIQPFQIKLYDLLGGKVNGYGRVFKVERNKKKLPMYRFRGDFKEVLPTKESGKYGCFYFVEAENTDVKKASSEVEISVVFIVDTFKAYSESSDVSDELLKEKLSDFFLRKKFFKENDFEITKGKDALSGFDSDLQHLLPYCLLRFKGNIIYYKNC